ncbi:hypothetical protein M0804_009083 [Polistes exclamans]|nr:hypothetical protein M0804_009083 [Polistes exclamans]
MIKVLETGSTVGGGKGGREKGKRKEEEEEIEEERTVLGMSCLGMSSGRPEDEQHSTLLDEGRIKDFDFRSPEGKWSSILGYDLFVCDLKVHLYIGPMFELFSEFLDKDI